MKNKYSIKIKKLAKKDLRSIYNYISIELVNQSAANKLMQKIKATFEKIALFPKSSQMVENNFVKNKNLRKALVNRYVIIYEINEEEKEIIILRVISGLQQYFKIL